MKTETILKAVETGNRLRKEHRLQTALKLFGIAAAAAVIAGIIFAVWKYRKKDYLDEFEDDMDEFDDGDDFEDEQEDAAKAEEEVKEEAPAENTAEEESVPEEKDEALQQAEEDA